MFEITIVMIDHILPKEINSQKKGGRKFKNFAYIFCYVQFDSKCEQNIIRGLLHPNKNDLRL